jgi:hypothetical protein
MKYFLKKPATESMLGPLTGGEIREQIQQGKVDMEWIASADVGGLFEKTGQLPPHDQPWLALEEVLKTVPEESIPTKGPAVFSEKGKESQEAAVPVLDMGKVVNPSDEKTAITVLENQPSEQPVSELGGILLELKQINKKLGIVEVAAWIYIVSLVISLLIGLFVLIGVGATRGNGYGQPQLNFRIGK